MKIMSKVAKKINNTLFKNPVLLASGTYGYGYETKKTVDIDKIGGIVTKSVTLLQREGNPPSRICETPAGMLNSIGLANVGVDRFCKEIIPYLNVLNTNIIINISGSSYDEYLQVLQKLEKSQFNCFGYEINISCPNVKAGGMEFGVSPKHTEKLTSELKKHTDKNIIMKLSPNVTSIQDIAIAAESGGADLISAINTVVGMGIDVNTRKAKLSTVYGGVSGPAIHPIAIANVHKISRVVSIPIVGIGGIAKAEDVVEFILAGADLVQIGTLNYKDPNIGINIIKDLEKFCINNKIDSLSDLKGKVEYNNE